MTRGEVSIKQNSHVHAVDTPALDAELRVDLDGHEPVVHAPPGVVVRHDNRDDVDEEEDARTDGGVAASRTSVEMRGQGVDYELAKWSALVAAILLVASGYAYTFSELIALIAMAAGGLLGYIGTRSFWRAP